MPDMTIVIQRKIQSQNKRDSLHWSKRHEERNEWLMLLRSRLMPRTPPDHLVRVRITSYRMRPLDFANLVGGSKQIPDCLKHLGYIKDDSPKWFECEYRQRPATAIDERTEIVIYDTVTPTAERAEE